jgi:hypothetical protein
MDVNGAMVAHTRNHSLQSAYSTALVFGQRGLSAARRSKILRESETSPNKEELGSRNRA